MDFVKVELLLIFALLNFVSNISGNFEEYQVGIFHQSSGYWVDGISGQIGELTNTGKFIIQITDETGCLAITQGNRSFAPSSGCTDKSQVTLQENNSTDVTQSWSFNSDGTIGNACDPHTKLVVNKEENMVELRKVDDCIGDLNGRIEFVVVNYEQEKM